MRIHYWIKLYSGRTYVYFTLDRFFALFIAYYWSRQLEKVITKYNLVEPMLCLRYMSFSIFMRFIVVAIMYHSPVESTTKKLDLANFQPLSNVIIIIIKV